MSTLTVDNIYAITHVNLVTEIFIINHVSKETVSHAILLDGAWRWENKPEAELSDWLEQSAIEQTRYEQKFIVHGRKSCWHYTKRQDKWVYAGW